MLTVLSFLMGPVASVRADPAGKPVAGQTRPGSRPGARFNDSIGTLTGVGALILISLVSYLQWRNISLLNELQHFLPIMGLSLIVVIGDPTHTVGRPTTLKAFRCRASFGLPGQCTGRG
ncbi:MAG: hypothetical protein GY703_16425 [Gammaproteobacteria bacterium]|nr:hypothetical protein [Gammaproteobacteria bacterium]